MATPAQHLGAASGEYKSNNHVIIGLGGTGGKIIREIRKTMAADPRVEGADAPVNFEFLWVDSSSADLNDRGPSWRVLGRSVALGEAQKHHLRGAGITALLEDPHSFPNIAPWIEPVDVLKEVVRSSVGEVLGGQRRKLGRFLFASSARDFITKLHGRVRALREKNKRTEVVFHICVGLAGGTGSGCLVDVVSQIRKEFPDPTARILVYALLPDQEPIAGWDTGNYHANGYAALVELNALAVDKYKPHDLAEAGEQLNLSHPVFNGCYVFYNKNESGVFVDVDKALPAIVGDFISQKTFGLKWGGLARAENAENGDPLDEPAPDGTGAERSIRFLTFGIRRLVVPEEEIREYLTYHFATQTARQLRYNYWQDGSGFADEPRPGNYQEVVRRAETQQRWLLTDEHLTLSRAILPDDAKNSRWKPIPDFWGAFVSSTVTDIQRNAERSKWLNRLKERCESTYNEGYRSMGGVQKFYEAKNRERVDMARHIRSVVEAELFAEWRTGHRSLSECNSLLQAFGEHVDEKIAAVDDRKQKLDDRRDAARARIAEVVHEWATIGVITDRVFGKGDKLFNAACEEVKALYSTSTYSEGWTFAKRLLQEVKNQIVELTGVVAGLNAVLTEASVTFETEVASRLVEKEAAGSSHEVKFYDRDLVVGLAKRLVTDEALQREQSQAARSRLVDASGEATQTFEAFSTRMDSGHIREVIEASCNASVQQAHANLGDDQKRVIGVNIIERLYDQYGANPDWLADFVRSTIAQAGAYMTFDTQERIRSGPGTKKERTYMQTAALFLPKCERRRDFADRVEEVFKNNTSINPFTVIREGVRANELIFIRVDNLFPLRFLGPIGFLKKKYEARCAQDRKHQVLLHSQAHTAPLPPLFVPTLEQTMGDRRPLLLLAKVLELLIERRNPATGSNEVIVQFLDEDGLEVDRTVGRTFLELMKSCTDQEAIALIEKRVEERLAQPDMKHEDRKKELFRDGVIAFINKVKTDCGGDQENETYKMFLTTKDPIKRRLGLA